MLNQNALLVVLLTAAKKPLLKIVIVIVNFQIQYPEFRLFRPTRALIVELILEKQRSFTTVKSYLLSTMKKILKETGQCRLYLAKVHWDTAKAAFELG